MTKFTGSNAGDILPSIPLGVASAFGDDQISGLGGNDILVGYSGNDTISGGTGADLIIGGVLDLVGTHGTVVGSGSDTADYSTSAAGVSVDLSQVSDLVASLLTLKIDVVNASVGQGGDAQGDILVGISNLTGSSTHDTLVGNSTANRLDGGGGADTLRGFGGNDTYIVDNIGDSIIEKAGGGTDTVLARASFTLTAGAEIEVFAAEDAKSTASLDLTGNSFAQTISGNAGANRIEGGGGADILKGGGGSDTYIVKNSGVKVIEANEAGTDTVQSSVSFDITKQYVENLALTGTASVNATGNGLSNVVTGNSGDNRISGGSSGLDTLTGGGGNDTFVFNSVLRAVNNLDHITDFSPKAVNNSDVIELSHSIFTGLDLGVLDAKFFAANAEGVAKDTHDRIVYETDTGKLFFDSNGSAAGGKTEFAVLDNHAAIHNYDFIVV